MRCPCGQKATFCLLCKTYRKVSLYHEYICALCINEEGGARVFDDTHRRLVGDRTGYIGWSRQWKIDNPEAHLPDDAAFRRRLPSIQG